MYLRYGNSIFIQLRLLKLGLLIPIISVLAQDELEDCSDLFISEIVFDNPISNAKLSTVNEVDYKYVELSSIASLNVRRKARVRKGFLVFDTE